MKCLYVQIRPLFHFNNSTNGTPVSLPKIWTVGTDTIPETLYVQGLSASGAMRDVKLRLLYTAGALTVCDDNIRLTVLKVETITAATVPSDTTRKKVGVGEDVALTLQPSSLSLVTWSISGNGTLSATTGNPITFTAHDRASTPNITATYGSGSCSVTFNVVEPDSESATKESEDVFPAGVQGAGMVLLITVNPTDVSFANVEMLEVPGPASNITGYFTNFPASTLFHFPDTEWGSLNAYNQWGDNASFGNFPSPWYAGSFQWNIPVQWRVVGKTSAGTVRNRLQTFSIAGTNGTSTVTKLGKPVTRTP